MDWVYGLIVFVVLTFAYGLLGDTIKHLRLRAGVRYGGEPDNYLCECGRWFFVNETREE